MTGRFVAVLLALILLATPLPAPADAEDPSPPEGVFVVRRDVDLWLVSLTDPSFDRQITFGSLGVQYAGSAVLSTGRFVYYTSQEAGDPDKRLFVVYRVRVAGGEPQRLFEFTGRALEPVNKASVSPDGRWMAFVDSTGLRMADLLMGGSTQVAVNVRGTVAPSSAGSTVGGALWAHSTGYLLFHRWFYESSGLFVTQPSSDSPVLTRLDCGIGCALDDAQWSPDGRRICVTEQNVLTLMVFDAATGSRTDLGWAGSCLWTPDGHLVSLGYTGATIVVHDEGLRQTLEIDVSSLNPEREFHFGRSRSDWVLKGWLRGSLLLAQRVPANPPRFSNFTLVGLDGAQTTLSVTADSIFDVLPAP